MRNDARRNVETSWPEPSVDRGKRDAVTADRVGKGTWLLEQAGIKFMLNNPETRQTVFTDMSKEWMSVICE
jgi:hypothetical protein